MAHALRLLVLSLLLSLSLASPASEQASKADLEAQKESLQLKIDSNQALTQKDIENLKSQLEGAGKRIDDQSNRIGDIGQSVDRFGILITLVVAIGGVFGYVSAKNKAKEEARLASQEWINNHQSKLENRIQQLEQTAEQAIQKAEQVREKAEQAYQQINDSTSRVEQHGQNADAVIEATMTRMTSQILQAQSISQEDKTTLHNNIKNITEKPESTYSFDDWNKRAFDCYNSEKFEEAALYWKRASEIPNLENIYIVTVLFFRAIALGKINRINEEISIYEQIIEGHRTDLTPAVRKQVAKARINKGFRLSQLGKSEDAIVIYDQIISDYAADSTNFLREQVIKAQVNKGACLGQLGRIKDAIFIYDHIISEYATDLTPALREQVAKALHNKGICLKKLGQIEDAIFLYNQVISDYADDSIPALQASVAGALNGKGFIYLQKAKQEWAEPEKRLAALEEARVSLSASVERYSASALTLGNLAYTHWLLGEQQASENTFRSALTAPENGGEFVYRATLDDIAQDPVPEDEGFRTMVERLWQEHQAQAPVQS